MRTTRATDRLAARRLAWGPVLGLTLGLASLGLAAPLFAQPAGEAEPTATVPAAATEDPNDPNVRFGKGLDHYEKGEHHRAVAVWEALLAELGPAKGWKLNYNLGLAYYAADDVSLAVRRFEAFLKRVARVSNALGAELEQRREDAAARVLAVKSSHGALVFPLPPRGRAGVVRVDGGAPQQMGLSVYVDPGSHSVEVTGPSGAKRTEQVDVAAGHTVRIDTRDPQPPPLPPPPLPPPPPIVIGPPAPRFPTVWVLAGAGASVLSFVLPAALGAAASDSREQAEQLGAGHSGYGSALDDFDAARTRYYASYALPAGRRTPTAEFCGSPGRSS